MRQLGLACSPERGEMREEFGVEEALFEGSLGDRQQEEEESRHGPALQHADHHHRALPAHRPAKTNIQRGPQVQLQAG